MAPGALLVTHTTGSPGLARQMAEEGSERGIRVVDAPVSGSAKEIEEGHVTVLLGGDPEHIAAAIRVGGSLRRSDPRDRPTG